MPLVGARPFLVEAAWRAAEGRLRCVVSALRGRSAEVPAACEVYVITLDDSATAASGAPPAELRVTDVQLLQVCVGDVKRLRSGFRAAPGGHLMWLAAARMPASARISAA